VTETPSTTPELPLPQPTPVPIVVTVVDSTATVATTTLSLVTMGNPAVASQAGRIAVLRAIATCGGALEPPDRSQSPLALRMGFSDSDVINAHAGAVIGNVALVVVAALVVGGTLIVGRHHYRKCRRMNTSLLRSAAWSRFPGWIGFPYSYFAGFVANSAMMVALRGDAASAVMCVIIAVIFLAGPFVAALYLFRSGQFRAAFECVKTETADAGSSPNGPRSCRDRWAKCIEPTMDWREQSTLGGAHSRTDYRLRQFGMFFDGYVGHEAWFYFVEIGVLGILASATGAIAELVSCAAGAWALFALYLGYCGLLVRLRPYATPLEMWLQGFVVLVQTMAVALAALQHSDTFGDEVSGAQTVATNIVTVASLAIVLLSLGEVVKAIKKQLRRSLKNMRRGVLQAALLSNNSSELTSAFLEDDLSPDSFMEASPHLMESFRRHSALIHLERVFQDERQARDRIQRESAEQFAALRQASEAKHKRAYWNNLHRDADALLDQLYRTSAAAPAGGNRRPAFGGLVAFGERDDEDSRPLWRASTAVPSRRNTDLSDATPRLSTVDDLDDLLAHVPVTQATSTTLSAIDLDDLLGDGPSSSHQSSAVGSAPYARRGDNLL
jgi:hypothetical protein